MWQSAQMSAKQRHLRTKRPIEDDEEPGPSAAPVDVRDKLEETKLLQRLRKKHMGMDAQKLAASGGPHSTVLADLLEEKAPEDDTGNVAKLMNSYVKATTVRDTDEDPHM